MKKEYTTYQWLLHKGALILIIVICSYIVYDILYGGTLDEIQSLINYGDMIYIYRQSIACVGGIPIFIYAIFFSLRSLFEKGITPSKKLSYPSLICAAFSTAAFIIGLIGTFLLPFGFMFSSYSNCPQENLGAYYVINLETCEHINPKNGNQE